MLKAIINDRILISHYFFVSTLDADYRILSEHHINSVYNALSECPPSKCSVSCCSFPTQVFDYCLRCGRGRR